jgi:superfamily II DNA/RNA helicase
MKKLLRSTLTLVRPARIANPEVQPAARPKRPDVDIQKRSLPLAQRPYRQNTEIATTDFKSLNLSPQLLGALSEMKIQDATEIQAKTIPALLQGRDVVFASHTGSGKTLT